MTRTYSHRGRRRRAAARRGFTLMEVLLVLIILVVIGSIVAPQIFGARDVANINAAKTQTGFIQDAARRYWMDMSKYPATLDELVSKPSDATQAEKWHGPYLDGALKPDPWENEYQFANPGKHNPDSIDVWSYGPDGQDGTDDDIGNWDKGK
jgi:general secretion pathway protein G